MPSRIDQIAKRVGVSTSTVARVLRGDVKGAQQRSIEKSREILRISEELGYQPNWRARVLSRGKTHTIGLLYSNPMWIFEDPMNDIAISFTESLQKQNYDLRLIPANDQGHWKELVLGGAVDGIAMLLHTPENAREAIERSGLPAVILGDKLDLPVPHVLPDDESGGYMAARHLIGLGHKRIVFYVAESIRPHMSVDERRRGYERAMREAGLEEQNTQWQCSTDEAMARLLSPNAPTAMIGYCHVEALRITHAAWAHGLSIPADLSFVAFNDMTMVEHMTPPLTVVGFDTTEMGRIGAELLLKQIESPDDPPPEDVLVRERLIVRSTTATPKNN